MPQLVSTPVTGYANETIFDYMGLPTKVPGLSHSALPLRAYNLIYNEWFRDQNLQNSVVNNVGDGPDSVSDYALLRRGKRHDYFTSALPWPQKGPSVALPLSGNAPVTGIGFTGTTNDSGAGLTYRESSPLADRTYTHAVFTNLASVIGIDQDQQGASAKPKIYTDLSAVTAATINQLRQSLQIQKLYERDARGGTRYTEIIRAHFGVTSPDARLQRPEYLWVVS